MRYLVVVLMILLLPLRGWTGDAMATHMASTAVGLEAQVAAADKTGTVADCAGHQAGEQTDSSVPKSAGVETCQACQACHTVALSASPTIAGVLFAAPTAPLAAAAQFTSADAALGQKPPIA